MAKFVVEYRLAYNHVVQVGVEADSQDAAETVAEQAFDAGTIWDDTPAIPLLYDDFEERDGNTLTFKAEPVDEWPSPDSSVTSSRATEAAWQALRALNEFAQARSRAGQTIRPSELIHLVGNYMHPFATKRSEAA